MQEKVATIWVVEREHEEPDYQRYEAFEVEVVGYYSYAPQTADDPGERNLDIFKVTWRNQPFSLTNEEEQHLRETWLEELGG